MGSQTEACQGGRVFAFSNHPALITVTQGIQDAFSFLGTTWKKWLPAAIAVAVFSMIVTAILGRAVTTDLYYQDPYTGDVFWNNDLLRRYIVASVAGGLATGLVTVIASWVFNATAIAGLRNRPVTLDTVIGRGALSFVASLLLGLVVAGIAIVSIIVLVVVSVAAHALGALLILAAVFVGIPVLIYVDIRLIFVTLAIFDGFGVIDAFHESWRLSKSAVLRMFGWGFMAALIVLGFEILGGIFAAVFSAASGTEPVATFITSFFSMIATVLGVYMMAVLYESQRARLDPNLYGPLPMQVAPGYGYGYPPTPPMGYGYPPTPPMGYGYPGNPPSPYGYPGNAPSTGIPGWNSGAPTAWPTPPAPTAPGGWNSGAPTAWPTPPAPTQWTPPAQWAPPAQPPAAWPAPPTPPAPPSAPTGQPDAPAPQPPASTEPPAGS